MRTFLTFGLLHLIACESDKSITVQNPAPTADIISHDDGSEVLEGFVITLEGVVSDANHTADQLTTRWKVGGEVVCDDIIPDEDGSTFCDVVFAPDDTEIILEVRDADNRPGEDAIFVSVVETEQPIAEIITPEADGVYYSDQLVTFEGLLSDAEDDADQLVAYWESSIDGVLSNVDSVPDNGGTVVGFGNLTEGQHAIQLHVEDTTGKLGQESVIITVGPPNSAPLCDISSPDDNSAGPEGEMVTFAGTVSDVDVPASYLSIEWSSDKDGVLGPSTPDSSGNVSFPFANLSVNTHVISMTVTDEVGAECVANRTYTVGTAPSITIDAPTDGDVINEGTPITFSATVSDAQDQANDVTLDWVANGSSISTQGATSSGEATFSNNTLTYGTYNLVVTATDTDGLTDSDQINFTVNGVPTAPIISINPDPATTSDGLSVSIDSPSVDPEGSTPTYIYEWQLGGQVQSSHTTSTLPSSATSKGEQWTVVVTPNDGITDGTPASASITIANTAPTLSGLSITPTGTTYNDDILTCSATVTDPDESPVPTYEWTVNGNVIGSSATLDLTSTGVMPDDVLTCTVTVSDSDGATATDSITRTVTNRAPTLASTVINPNTNVTTDTLLTCSTTVTDADGESLTPTYTWSVGSNNNAGTGTTLQLTPSMGNPGDGIVCTVDVADGYGGTAVDTAVATIINTDPVISDVSISYNGDLTSTTSLTCNHTATDADNQTLTPTYTWTNLSTNTQFSSTASTLQLNPTTVSPTDVVECSVTVTDTSNGTATLAANETVLNTDPTFITPATVTTSGTQVGDTWTCYAAGTDQDDGTLTPTYEWQDANGAFVASGASLTLSSSNSTPNADLTCVATLTDSLNATATSSASATVTNTAPTFDVSASIAPNTGVVTASLLTCSGSASDADGDTPTVSYAWSNSNGTTYGSTGNTLQLTPSTVSPADVVTCTLTATDDAGETATSSASVTVDNTLPTLTAAISATDTSNTGELTCSATASDLDDFPTTPTLTYEWFNSNGSLGTSNPLQLDATMGVDGDTIDCTVTATDLSGGAVTDTASLTITNTAPVIDSISLNPSTIDANTTSVTCVVSSSDADGDTVTEIFEWYVDGTLQSETTNMYSGPFIVGTLLACRSTPNDGKTDGDFAEDTATIQNTAPVVDSVTLSPSTVYTNDTITATAVLSDVDGSQSGSLTANYEWFVDNVSVQNGSSNTLDGVSMFNRDQSVYVEVTPNDGVDDGSPLNSGSIIVSNTAPVMSSVTVTPDPATAGQDDLTCDAVATDADGDAILYTYEWSDSSGVQQTMTEVSDVSDTFLAAGLAEDTWTCDVTPYDGTDYGSALSDSVTVESGCSSLEFDATEYIDAGSSSALTHPGSEFTAEAWIYWDGTNNGRNIIISTHTHSNNGWDIQINTNNQWMILHRTSNGSDVSASSLDSATVGWHHIAGVFTNIGQVVSVNLYVDGSLVAANSQNGTFANDGTEHLFIGNINEPIYGHPSSVRQFYGLIGMAKISSSSVYNGEFTPEMFNVDSHTVALWELSSGGNISEDQSGNGHQGTINGATWVNTCPEEDLDGDGVAAWEDCDDDDASIPTVDDFNCDGFADDCAGLEFGSNDSVRSDPSVTLDPNPTDFTFETWIKKDVNLSEDWYPIATRGWRTTSNQFFLAVRGTASHWCGTPVGGVHFQMQGGNICVYTPPLEADKWYHLAAVHSNGNMELYLDGELVSTPNSTPAVVPAGDPILEIGMDSTSNYFFSGHIDSVHYSASVLYSSNFTPAELTPGIDTKILWKFNEGSGSVATDESGNSNDGTITGPAWVNTCPEEDLDGDGVAVWEDCDDNDASITTCAEPIAHYPFNDNTTDIITGVSGTNNGASLTSGADGQSNSAYNFSGHFMEWNGYSMDATQGFSASLWFNSNVSGSYDKTLLSSSANSNQYTMLFGPREPEKTLKIRLEDNWSGITWECAEQYTNGVWHHTVVTWDGGQNLNSMQIYLDGSPCTMSRNYNSSITIFDMEDFWVGGRWGLTDYIDGQQFEGSIDDVRIFDTVLTQTEVDNLSQNVQ